MKKYLFAAAAASVFLSSPVQAEDLSCYDETVQAIHSLSSGQTVYTPDVVVGFLQRKEQSTGQAWDVTINDISLGLQKKVSDRCKQTVPGNIFAYVDSSRPRHEPTPVVQTVAVAESSVAVSATPETASATQQEIDNLKAELVELRKQGKSVEGVVKQIGLLQTKLNGIEAILAQKADKSYVDEQLATKLDVDTYEADKATFVTKLGLETAVDEAVDAKFKELNESSWWNSLPAWVYPAGAGILLLILLLLIGFNKYRRRGSFR